PQRATLDYIARVFHNTRPLVVFPLRDAKVSLGHDFITVPLQGFLFVPPGSVASVREYGDLHIFIRRMFICEREKDLLPPWARFVRGVIECPLLQPTASRESIHQDDNFDLVRRALEQQLGAALQALARDDPSTWRKVVRGHPDVNLVQLDGEAQQLLRPAQESTFTALLSHYREQGVRVAVAAFKPAEVPAIVLYPQGAELAREAESSLQAGDLPGPLAGLVH